MELDFIKIVTSAKKKDELIVYPQFRTIRTNDLMTRGGYFYAFWNDETKLWSTDEDELFTIIDTMVKEKAKTIDGCTFKTFDDFDSGLIEKWRRYCKTLSDRYKNLDTKIIFEDTNTKKTDYASMKLPYVMEDIPTPCYDELIGTLYDEEEREKLEWAIGSVIAGDSKTIQKFYYIYGSAGAGKSTVLNIISSLFDGYVRPFNSKALGDGNNSFALESLAANPLIAIDQDGDLSRINDNTRLNTIVSHERMTVNEKFKSTYSMRFNTTLFIGSNKPVRITDSKSGLRRRLIDIHPSGNKITPVSKYNKLFKEACGNERPGIAKHCFDVYLARGKSYYDSYEADKMMEETNDVYNFVLDNYIEWVGQEEVTLASLWKLYQNWVEETHCNYSLPRKGLRTELEEYFERFVGHSESNKQDMFINFKIEKIRRNKTEKGDLESWLSLKPQHSLLDDILKDCPAQYSMVYNGKEQPANAWSKVKTKLSDINTSETHFVKSQEKYPNLVVLDLDKKNANGEKDLLTNLIAANEFKETYAETSKSGKALHLYYFYDDDVDELAKCMPDDKDIEIKVYRKSASLRRKVNLCNDVSITVLHKGELPLHKKGKNMVDTNRIENETHLVAMIRKCLKKEHHGHTKPEVDFIAKLLNDAYANEELSYDIRELRPKIVTFAMSSTNQSQTCFEIVSKLHYCSKDFENVDEPLPTKSTGDWEEALIVFYDVEVLPNLFIICWKKQGDDNKVVRMINPTPNDVKKLFSFRLVGFNNRKYDNHIIYARAMGYSIKELYNLSQKIIGNNRGAFFGSAYGLSYTDIYDYCSNPNKMSLKKWEIKLGIFHLENAHPWDQPVDEEFWEEIADYCENDVIATEAVWNATQADFRARLILSELSGLTPNDTTNNHTQQIIFGDDKNPQREFNLPDLSKEFPGYEFKQNPDTKKWESWYMGEKVGEGGWVFSKPGMYFNGICEDVSGMHPSTIKALNLFGETYTKRYYDLVLARTYIKHGEYDKLESMFDGKLMKYITTDEDAKALSNALKTAVNAVYGMTYSKYNFRCTVPNNRENVVAKRGALFMIKLKNEVEKKGYEVIHCKTDSIKLANPDNDILDFIVDFGKQYGYNFEVEDVFERICLVNDSTFIAKTEDGNWFAKAAQFQHPYVFKELFTKETIAFEDLCETKNVSKGAMYLDMNERLGEDEHDYHFVGRVGQFTPVLEGANGGRLVKSEDQVKYDAVNGTKDRRWLESETIKNLGLEDRIDYGYFDDLRDKAHAAVSKYGDFDIFVNATPEQFRSYIEMRDSDYDVVPF